MQTELATAISSGVPPLRACQQAPAVKVRIVSVSVALEPEIACHAGASLPAVFFLADPVKGFDHGISNRRFLPTTDGKDRPAAS
ncbi:hypothetical protein ACNEP5_27970 [Escherichia coli]